jgi:superfamily I DNA/RNA helicase
LWTAFEQLVDGSLSLRHTTSVVAAFKAIVAKLDALEKLPTLADVVDSLFPSGDDDVREVREVAVSALGGIAGDDREALRAAMVQAISQPEISDQVTDVRIMSLHKSKGLSASVTIIAGCVEGLLPRQPEAGTPFAEADAMIEEQRRLFFVGVTRVKASPAQNKPGVLILTYAGQMPSYAALQAGIAASKTQYGKAQLIASRFIKELGPSAPAPVMG